MKKWNALLLTLLVLSCKKEDKQEEATWNHPVLKGTLHINSQDRDYEYNITCNDTAAYGGFYPKDGIAKNFRLVLTLTDGSTQKEYVSQWWGTGQQK